MFPHIERFASTTGFFSIAFHLFQAASITSGTEEVGRPLLFTIITSWVHILTTT
jgi:hypothetical protein